MAQEIEKIKKNWVRLISLALVVLLLLALFLFHRQINNFFIPVKATANIQTKPVLTVKPVITPSSKPQAQTPIPSAKTTTPKSSAKTTTPKSNTNSMLLNKQGFTLQLMGAADFNELSKFVAANKLQGKCYILHSINKGQDWYTLIYGVYPTHEAAEAARAILPDALKQSKPWIRSMDSVHNVILQNKQ